MPSRDPDDPDFRRLWYVRYADDFLLGFSRATGGSRGIKRRLASSCASAQAGTLRGEDPDHARADGGGAIPRLRDRHPDADCKHDRRGQTLHQRRVGLKVPADVIRERNAQVHAAGQTDPSGRARQRHGLQHRDAVPGGVSGLRPILPAGLQRPPPRRLHWVMETFAVKTLASKHQTTGSPIRDHAPDGPTGPARTRGSK